jgi:hypothetical protein
MYCVYSSGIYKIKLKNTLLVVVVLYTVVVQ